MKETLAHKLCCMLPVIITVNLPMRPPVMSWPCQCYIVLQCKARAKKVIALSGVQTAKCNNSKVCDASQDHAKDRTKRVMCCNRVEPFKHTVLA